MSDVLPSSPDSAVHRRETERLQRLLLRAERLALLGSWELDLETGTVRASPGLQELFQRPLGESGQTTFVEALGMIHEDDRARVAAAYAQFLEVGTPAPIDFRLRLSDGSCRHVHCDSEVVEYDGQTPKVVAGFVLDTTRQVAAEAALRESERRLRQVLDGMMIHAGLISLDGVLLDVNRVPLEFAGLQREAVIGRHLWETSWFDGLPHQQLKVRDALHRVRNGESVRCDLQCRLDDEHLRTVDASFCPLRDEAGVITQIIGSAVDITDRLRDQDELHNHQDELTHVLRVVTMGELAAGIVHELNQPLMAITNYAERLKLYAGSLTAGEAASIVKTADKIADQSVRAGDIIRRLRDLARKSKPHRSTAELNTLIQRTLSLFLPQARLASVNIEFQSWPKPLHVLIDSIQVQQVLLNLLQNAVDAMQNSSTTDRLISIQLAPDDMQRVRIVVTDSGPNVTPEQEDKLFSAFYTTKSSGLGMGLPISRSIIRAHGGSLEYERCANSGAVFVITLPVI